MYCPSLWPPGPGSRRQRSDIGYRISEVRYQNAAVFREKRVGCVFGEEASAACFLISVFGSLDGGCRWVRAREADRAISTGRLRGLPRFHLRPIDVVVYHGSWRDLVLRGVSRLDAFSGYPVRT